jgi:hypothetical protein
VATVNSLSICLQREKDGSKVCLVKFAAICSHGDGGMP